MDTYKNKITQQLQLLGLSRSDDEAMISHGALVLQTLEQKIAGYPDGMPFSDFMEFALYEPGLGYYSAGKHKIGSKGDFVTAPEISTLFSSALAHSIADYFTARDGSILEFGAGLGTLAVDVLLYLEHQQALPDNYYILDRSADLRQQQKALIAQKVPHLLNKVQWLDCLPSAFKGVIIANEVIDAMPACPFVVNQNRPQQVNVVATDKGLDFMPVTVDEKHPLSQWYASAQGNLGRFPDGYLSEVNFAMLPWLDELAGIMEEGLFYLIDYGYTGSEYYHPARQQGTLMCYFRHHAHSDPLMLVGLQDITCHVDFTRLAHHAVACGLDVRGYDNQANFLMNNDILRIAQSMTLDDEKERLNMSAQLKRMLMPGGMGEVFKVMVLSKHYDKAIAGCHINDQRPHL